MDKSNKLYRVHDILLVKVEEEGDQARRERDQALGKLEAPCNTEQDLELLRKSLSDSETVKVQDETKVSGLERKIHELVGLERKVEELRTTNQSLTNRDERSKAERNRGTKPMPRSGILLSEV